MPIAAESTQTEESPSELPFQSNVGFMITYRCTIACPHCVVEAGPHRKERMPEELGLTWIRQAVEYRAGQVKGLALTGGEPFYDLDSLRRFSDAGRDLGLVVSVVTNAFWASTLAHARTVLSRVPAIQMLALSTDAYHQKAIPFANIRNAIQAARDHDRLYSIAVCTPDEDDPEYRRVIGELTDIGEAERIRTSITFPVGRAARPYVDWKYRMSTEPVVSACSMAGSPVVFPDGKVLACIGPVLTLAPVHPLFLGDLTREPLSDILERSESNPVLHIIRAWGPHKLITLLRENGYGSLVPAGFIRNCTCDVCYKLMSRPQVVTALTEICGRPQVMRTVAYARIYYLHETRMAELLRLDTPQADPASVTSPDSR